MVQVTGMDADRMKQIENQSIVNGEVDPATGVLILTRFDGTEINAGVVSRSILVVTSATRPVPAVEGMVIYETDTERIWAYDGTTWRYRGGIFLCTSGTRPASPFEGLRIHETDTDLVYVYTGSAWQVTLGGKVPFCSVTRSAVQNVANNTVATIAFDTEVSDPYGIHASGVFTVPAGMAGLWRLTTRVEFSSDADGAREIYYSINAVDTPLVSLSRVIASPAGGATTLPGTVEDVLAAGDAVRVRAIHNAGNALDLQAVATFTFVGPT